MIEYNNKKLGDLRQDKGRYLKDADLKRYLNISNISPVKEWENGRSFNTDRLADFCNIYECTPNDFYLCDGKPIEPNNSTISSPNSNKNNTTDDAQKTEGLYNRLLQKEEELSNTRLEALKNIQDVKDECSRLKLEKLEDSIRIRFEERNRYDDMMKKRENDLKAEYEKKLEEKEQTINELREQMINLEVKSRTLETVTALKAQKKTYPMEASDPTKPYKHK